MRLLNTETGEFHQIVNPSQARYAIVSHVWSKGGEMSYQDVQNIRLEQGRSTDRSLLLHLSAKVRNACALALSDGLLYIWIDTCCIDKASSAELSEAINSMYAWYAGAAVCYAYLEDVEISSLARPRTVSNPPQLVRPLIVGCEWFTRGWTLQELIAPRFVVFVDTNWKPFGTKDSYIAALTSITRVPGDVLQHVVSADAYSVATRMLWASRRTTTRVEDQAYSLMGIFGVHMPTIYGEGTNAFRRLQEEILKRDPDQSILVWGFAEVFLDWSAFVVRARSLPDPASTTHGVLDLREPLATIPESFGQSAALLRGTLGTLTPQQLAERIGQPSDREAPWPDIAVTPVGIHTRVPIIPLPSVDVNRPLYAAFLACEYHTSDGEPLLPVLLLSPMDAKRASYAGATKAKIKGRIHYYIAGDVYLVPSPATLSRPFSPVLAQFDDICLGFPHASRLQRYHPLPTLAERSGASQATVNRQIGIIEQGFRLCLAPKASNNAWASYQLCMSKMLDTRSGIEGVSSKHKLPPTYIVVFMSKDHRHDQVIIRLGPCIDTSRHSSPSSIDRPFSVPSYSAASSSMPDYVHPPAGSATDTHSSWPLRAIVSYVCGDPHHVECTPPAESALVRLVPRT
ncbi:heterokaryon incompatibility protein-domain-containing protein [Cerioporus squamosus]|nr:heterokaryon incompatibility protein-domain-containing protein [Cerioporus squamosus]